MIMLTFLKSIRRELNRSAMRMLVASAATVGFTEFSVADEPLVTNVGRFEIPFDIEAKQASDLKALLYFSVRRMVVATGKN